MPQNDHEIILLMSQTLDQHTKKLDCLLAADYGKRVAELESWQNVASKMLWFLGALVVTASITFVGGVLFNRVEVIFH